ncbi:MAG: DUF742 domain-containing protein [Pseudonocardiaceae bacterium]|nr:DUF742 domain-containing protein [Pseudonocardiaceae bacterium]
MTEPGAQEGSGETPEPTFADVLNNLSLDSGRTRRRRRKDEPPAQPPVSLFGVTPEPPLGGGTDEEWEPTTAEPVPGDDPEDDAAAVRPYTWTRGRTRPAHDFAVETLVSTSEHGHDVVALASVEHRAVAELCSSPRSVAEVAALLPLPLGVAKVLLADMTDMDLVVVHDTTGASGDAPDRALMERVLSGLRRL